jgi:hypothetical protein
MVQNLASQDPDLTEAEMAEIAGLDTGESQFFDHHDLEWIRALRHAALLARRVDRITALAVELGNAIPQGFRRRFVRDRSRPTSANPVSRSESAISGPYNHRQRHLGSSSSTTTSDPRRSGQNWIHPTPSCQIRAQLCAEVRQETLLTRENTPVAACPPKAGAQARILPGALIFDQRK